MTIRNYSAAWGWLIGSAFLLMLLLMTGIVLYQGTPEGYEPVHIWVAMALFWIFGLGIGGWVFNRPLVEVIIQSGKIRLLKRTLIKIDKREYNIDDVLSSEVIETADSDGDPYFITRVTFSDGFSTDLAEAHNREKCEQILRTFLKEMKLQRFS